MGAAAVGLKTLRSYSQRERADGVCPLPACLVKDISTSPRGGLSPTSVEIFGNHSASFSSTMVTGSEAAITLSSDEMSQGDLCVREYLHASDFSINNGTSKGECPVSPPVQELELKPEPELELEVERKKGYEIEKEKEQDQEGPFTSSFDMGSQDALRFHEDKRYKRRDEHPISHRIGSDIIMARTTVKQNIGRTLKNTTSSLASLPAPIPRPTEHSSLQNSDPKRKTNSFPFFSRQTEDNYSDPCEITRMKNHDFLKQKGSTNGSEQCDKPVTRKCSVNAIFQNNHFYNEEYSAADNFFSVKRVKDDNDVT